MSSKATSRSQAEASGPTYFLSLGYLTNEGYFVGPSGLDKFTTRLKGSHGFLDNLTVSGNFAYTSQAADLVQQGSNISGVLLGALRTPPDFNNRPYINPETGLHRSYRCPLIEGCPQNREVGRGYDNPFWVANEINNTTDVGRVFGNIRADYQPWPWLNLTEILGADYYSDQRFTIFPKSSGNNPSGRLIRGVFRQFNIDHSLLATGSAELNENVSGSLTLGQNLRQAESDNLTVQGDALVFQAEELPFTVDQIPDEFKARVRTAGYFVDANVDLYDQLFLSGGVRYEGSNTFGGADNYYFFPSAGAAWTFTALDAFEDMEWLNFGKVRFAYGVAGTPPPVFSNVSAFETEELSDGWVNVGLQTLYGGNEGIVSEDVLGNEGIEPERTTEFEAGLDLAVWDSRLSLSGTAYYQRTTDAILDVDTPPSIGYAAIPLNGAEFENRGLEFALDIAAVRTENFSWDLSATWSKNDSEVLNLLGTEEIGLAGFVGTSASVVEDICGPAANEACPFQVIFGTDFVRFGRGIELDIDGDGVPESIDQAFPNAPAGALYVGADGFPVFDAQERVLGNPNPDWSAALRSTFRIFDNLTISGLIDTEQGQEHWNGTKGALFFFGTHAGTLPFHGDGVAHVFGCGNPAVDPSVCGNPSAFGPGAGQEVTLTAANWALGGLGNGFTGPAVQFIEDASFVKLRDLTVSYLFDGDWVRNLGFGVVELAVSGQNLFTWTDYTGLDPELNLTGQTTGRGLEYFNNPRIRSFTVELRVTR